MTLTDRRTRADQDRPALSLVPPSAPPATVAGETLPASDIVTSLLLRAGQGDQAAFARLYDVVIPAVLAAAHLLARPGQAEAVAEQACVDVWRWSPGFPRSGATPLAWIIARVERAACSVGTTG